MSLVTALDTAVSGLRVAQLQVSNAANNIANALDPNFTRKTALQAPINLSNGGGGVTLIGYDRAINVALNNTYRDAISNSGLHTQSNDVFGQIKDIYGMSSDTVRLSTTLADFIGSWQSFSAAPEDSVRQREVVSKGDSFASEIRRISGELERYDTSLQQQQSDQIDKVNTILTTIDELNNQIAAANAVNEPTGNLEDQRDSSLRDLSSYVKVRVLDGDQGRVRIISPGGFVLLDANPVRLVYNAGDYETSSGVNVNRVLTGGSLESLYNARYDGSPATPDTDPSREVLRKLRSQLDALANAFLAVGGTPATFADAYNGATQISGEQLDSFFTGSGRGNIAVNTALLSGSTNVKRASGDVVVAALTNGTRSFTAAGISVAGTSYSGFAGTMVGLLSSAAETVQGRADLSTSTESTYKERYSNVVGVNVDEELINLTRFQNSYSAVARVVSVVREMFDVLDGLTR